jgi:hypothetical protein
MGGRLADVRGGCKSADQAVASTDLLGMARSFEMTRMPTARFGLRIWPFAGGQVS